MILRGLAIGLAAGAAFAIWYAYQEITLLRRTVFWEYRFIVLLVAGILGLSIVEWLLGLVTRLFSRSDAGS